MSQTPTPTPECERCAVWVCENCGWTRTNASLTYEYPRCHKCGWQDGTFKPVRHRPGSLRYGSHEPTGHDHYAEENRGSECPDGCPYRTPRTDEELMR